MDYRERIESYKRQFRECFETYEEEDPTCAYAAGMLVILSALKKHDHPKLALEITLMHKALREIGEERGWGVDNASG